MNATIIPFAGVQLEAGIELNKTPGLDYSAPIALPETIHIFDDDADYFCLGRYGEILPGGWHEEEWKILDTLADYKGPILIPFGEPMMLLTCGTHVRLARLGDRIVIDYDVKDLRRARRFMFQVHFPLREPNIVEFHYYNVQTGFRTLVGVKSITGLVAEWGAFDPDRPYHKVALRFDTANHAAAGSGPGGAEPTTEPSPTAPAPGAKPTRPPRPGYRWVRFSTPMGPRWKEIKIEGGESPPDPELAAGWITVWQGGGYRLQEARK